MVLLPELDNFAVFLPRFVSLLVDLLDHLACIEHVMKFEVDKLDQREQHTDGGTICCPYHQGRLQGLN